MKNIPASKVTATKSPLFSLKLTWNNQTRLCFVFQYNFHLSNKVVQDKNVFIKDGQNVNHRDDATHYFDGFHECLTEALEVQLWFPLLDNIFTGE